MIEPTEPIRQNATRPAAEHARNSMMHRWLPIGMVLIVAGIIGLALLLFLTSSRDTDKITALGGQVNTLAGQQAKAAQDAQQLAEQIRGMGGTPVVEPPQVVQPGPAGLPGVAGQNGSPGLKGDQGDPGPTGPAGKTGPTGPSGPAGDNGQPGVDGNDGAPGAAGAAGQPGAKGDPGQNGTDGQPPAGWTANYSDGSTETCTRADNFDPNNPQYTCTISPPTSQPTIPIPS